MTYEEYRAQLDKALEEVDWMHPGGTVTARRTG